MKYLIVLVALFSFAFAQDVSTRPSVFGSKVVLDDAGGKKTITTSDTTDAFVLKSHRGAVTAFVSLDSTVATTDAELIEKLWIDYEVYSEATGLWHSHWKGTLQDSSSVLNGEFAVQLPDLNSFKWGDQGRLIFSMNNGEKVDILVGIGGQ